VAAARPSWREGKVAVKERDVVRSLFETKSNFRAASGRTRPFRISVRRQLCDGRWRTPLTARPEAAVGRGPRRAGRRAEQPARPRVCAHTSTVATSTSRLYCVDVWLPQMKTPAASVSHVSRRHTRIQSQQRRGAFVVEPRECSHILRRNLAPHCAQQMAALVFAGSL